MTERQESIMDHTGANTWDDVISNFAGMSLIEIWDKLNRMFPADDNKELAEEIFFELH